MLLFSECPLICETPILDHSLQAITLFVSILTLKQKKVSVIQCTQLNNVMVEYLIILNADTSVSQNGRWSGLQVKGDWVSGGVHENWLALQTLFNTKVTKKCTQQLQNRQTLLSSGNGKHTLSPFPVFVLSEVSKLLAAASSHLLTQLFTS